MRTTKKEIQTNTLKRLKKLEDVARVALIAGVEAEGTGKSNEFYTVYDKLTELIKIVPEYSKTRKKWKEVFTFSLAVSGAITESIDYLIEKGVEIPPYVLGK
jgi:hypothetical protein